MGLVQKSFSTAQNIQVVAGGKLDGDSALKVKKKKRENEMAVIILVLFKEAECIIKWHQSWDSWVIQAIYFHC